MEHCASSISSESLGIASSFSLTEIEQDTAAGAVGQIDATGAPENATIHPWNASEELDAMGFALQHGPERQAPVTQEPTPLKEHANQNVLASNLGSSSPTLSQQ